MMAVNHPTQIEAALLYDRPGTVRLDAVLRHLNLGLKALGMAFTAGKTFDEGRSGVFSCGEIFILISQNPRPLAPEGFRGALSSTMVLNTLEDAPGKVGRHRENIFITVSRGLPMPADLAAGNPDLKSLLELALPPIMQDRGLFLNMVRFLMGMIEAVITERGDRPSCVHWLQSDLLVEGDVAYQLCCNHDLLSLLCRNDFYVSADAAGGQTFGIQTTGARHFLGSEVRFEPVPIHPVALLKWTRAFLFMSFDKLIPDGDTFGTETDLRIRVLHGSDPGIEGGGLIRLVLEHSAEHGFSRDDERSASPTGAASAAGPGRTRPAPWTVPSAGAQTASADLVRTMRSRIQTPPPRAQDAGPRGLLQSLLRRLH